MLRNNILFLSLEHWLWIWITTQDSIRFRANVDGLTKHRSQSCLQSVFYSQSFTVLAILAELSLSFSFQDWLLTKRRRHMTNIGINMLIQINIKHLTILPLFILIIKGKDVWKLVQHWYINYILRIVSIYHGIFY